MAKVKALLHEFRMGDVDDVDIYVAHPIWEWQQTEHGKWCMEHAEDPAYHIGHDPHFASYIVRITGLLEEKDYTYFMLKWCKEHVSRN